MFSLLTQNPIAFVILALTLILSITVHEFSHAFTAMKLGDYSAKYMGRVSLNPLAHLDPLGTMMLLLVGFGWGKPVPFNPYNLKNPKRDAAIISFAGPFSNFMLAIVTALLIKILPPSSIVSVVLGMFVYYNLLLGFFNLIPFHPLDGFKVVYGLLPTNLAMQWQETERYGVFALLILIFTGSIGVVVTPFINLALNLLGVR